MLTYLAVKNIAVIEKVSLEFEKGLNVITGETGAGKSVLVGALKYLTGDRLGKVTPETKRKISEHNSSKEFQEYQREIKKKNKSFNTSKPEIDAHSKLIEFFGDENVCYHYVDENRYPFECDFYIKSEDLFIELNYHWTHGPHAFDINSVEDITLLNKWRIKQAEGKTFYKVAEDVWTIRDVQKFIKAKNNQLNYKVFYKPQDFNLWISTLQLKK